MLSLRLCLVHFISPARCKKKKKTYTIELILFEKDWIWGSGWDLGYRLDLGQIQMC